MGPIAGGGCIAVFHGIPVDVVEVALEVRFILDGVFPISALPDATATNTDS